MVRKLSGVSFIRALSLSWWASASWPNHLPKVQPPNSITFRVRISDKNFGRTTWTNLQPTALTIALFGSVDTLYPIYYLKSECESVSPSVLSDSLRSHGLQTARLLCPWNSPGKNTEVGSHSLHRGNLPNPGIEPGSPALQAGSLLSEPPGKPIYDLLHYKNDQKQPIEI